MNVIIAALILLAIVVGVLLLTNMAKRGKTPPQSKPDCGCGGCGCAG